MKPIQKYPIGIQHFQVLREGGYVYVDKTEQIFNFAESVGFFFLSRPRRFGKSLLLDTMQCLFEGKKELFAGLWIEDRWNWAETFPVVRISFSNMGIQELGLEEAIATELDKVANSYQLELTQEGNALRFREIILTLAKINKVVILIDEYDKPIIDTLKDRALAEQNRATLKTLYSVLKDLGGKTRLLFITGVSKFSQVSIFSDLNNLADLSLHRSYGTLTGITQTELEQYFSEELKQCDKAEVRRWYNGYTWDLKNRVYNPFSILNFFSDINHFRNYWFATGTPTFLIDELKKHQLTHFEEVQVTENVLNEFNFERLNPYSLLYQTGYLTLESYNHRDLLYTLRIPNQEVSFSLNSYLLDAYRNDPFNTSTNLIARLRKAFEQNDFEHFQEDLNEVFQCIDYQFWEKNLEKFYHGIVHLTFNLIGIFLDSEVKTNRGRCDAVVKTDDHIFVLEFKLNQSAQVALDSIFERGYLEKFKNMGKGLVAMGVNFDGLERKVDGVMVSALDKL